MRLIDGFDFYGLFGGANSILLIPRTPNSGKPEWGSTCLVDGEAFKNFVATNGLVLGHESGEKEGRTQV